MAYMYMYSISHMVIHTMQVITVKWGPSVASPTYITCKRAHLTDARERNFRPVTCILLTFVI